MVKLMTASSIQKGYWIELYQPQHDTWSWVQITNRKEVYEPQVRTAPTRLFIFTLNDTDEQGTTQATESDLFLASETEPVGVANRHPVPTWDEYFLELAKTVSLRAKCRRRTVGAVIVDSANKIVSTGYNGPPESSQDVPANQAPLLDCLEGGCPRGLQSKTDVKPYTAYDGENFCIASHAEENAINFRNTSVRGCSIYVTDKPCYNCTRTLLGNGVVMAYWPGGASTVRELFQKYVQELSQG
jgi:dCMP deaminase